MMMPRGGMTHTAVVARRRRRWRRRRPRAASFPLEPAARVSYARAGQSGLHEDSPEQAPEGDSIRVVGLGGGLGFGADLDFVVLLASSNLPLVRHGASRVVSF
jgi:hypothetical protein